MARWCAIAGNALRIHDRLFFKSLIKPSACSHIGNSWNDSHASGSVHLPWTEEHQVFGGKVGKFVVDNIAGISADPTLLASTSAKIRLLVVGVEMIRNEVRFAYHCHHGFIPRMSSFRLPFKEGFSIVISWLQRCRMTYEEPSRYHGHSQP